MFSGEEEEPPRKSNRLSSPPPLQNSINPNVCLLRGKRGFSTEIKGTLPTKPLALIQPPE